MYEGIIGAKAFFSVTSYLLKHMCGYFLQLQIPLSQVHSSFAPIIPSYLCCIILCTWKFIKKALKKCYYVTFYGKLL